MSTKEEYNRFVEETIAKEGYTEQSVQKMREAHPIWPHFQEYCKLPEVNLMVQDKDSKQEFWLCFLAGAAAFQIECLKLAEVKDGATRKVESIRDIFGGWHKKK